VRHEALCIAILIAGACCAQSPPSPSPSKIGQDKRRSSSTISQESDDSISSAPSAQTTVRVVKQDEKEPYKESRDSPSGWWVIVPTILIACATLVQVLIYSRQADYMRRGLRISIQQTRTALKAAKAAKASADTAKDAASFAEETLRLTERADLLVDAITLSDPQRAAHSFVSVRLKNFGKTRAEDAVVGWWVGLRRTDDGFPRDARLTAAVVIGAGGSFFVTSDQTLLEICAGDSRWREVSSGAVELVIIGRTAYTDVFKNRHILEFFGVLNHRTWNFELRKNHNIPAQKEQSTDLAQPS
jgi:hypothetical protein